MKRRSFLSNTSIAGAGAALSPAAFLQAAGPTGAVKADLLIKSARVYTMEGSRPLAEAVAVLGDRIIAAGTNDELKALEGPATQVIDGAGMTVTPGFIDAHSHPDGASEVTGADANLRSI